MDVRRRPGGSTTIASHPRGTGRRVTPCRKAKPQRGTRGMSWGQESCPEAAGIASIAGTTHTLVGAASAADSTTAFTAKSLQ